MNHWISITKLTTLSWLLMIFVAGAQNSSSAKPKSNPSQQPSTIQFRMVTAMISGNLDTLHVTETIKKKQTDKSLKWKKVDLNVHSATPPSSIQARRVIHFKSSADPKSSTVAVATLPSDSVTKDWIFLLLPERNTGKSGNLGSYRVIAFPEEKIHWGAYAVYNFTGANLKLQINQSKKVIKHNENFIIPSNKKSDWVSIVGLVDKKPRILRQTKWRLDDNQREMIIFFRKADGNIQGRHIIDHQHDPKG